MRAFTNLIFFNSLIYSANSNFYFFLLLSRWFFTLPLACFCLVIAVTNITNMVGCARASASGRVHWGVGVFRCMQVCIGMHGCVWDESSEFLLETRVLTSADFNTYPIRIFFHTNVSCGNNNDKFIKTFMRSFQ